MESQIALAILFISWLEHFGKKNLKSIDKRRRPIKFRSQTSAVYYIDKLVTRGEDYGYF